jgi:hypothetical protein
MFGRDYSLRKALPGAALWAAAQKACRGKAALAANISGFGLGHEKKSFKGRLKSDLNLRRFAVSIQKIIGNVSFLSINLLLPVGRISSRPSQRGRRLIWLVSWLVGWLAG